MCKYLPQKYSDLTTLEFYGISHDDPSITTSNNIRYDACIAIPEEIEYNDTLLALPSCIYIEAIYIGEFEELTEAYHYLIYNWLDLYQYSFNKNIYPFEKFNLIKYNNTLKIDNIKIYIPVN